MIIPKNYIIQVKKRNYGPLSKEEVLFFLHKKQISLNTFAYSLDNRQWMMLGDFEEFSDQLPPKPLSNIEKKIFYLYQKDKDGKDGKDGKVLGPYTKSEILTKLNSVEITFFDYVFPEDLGNWVLIKQIPAFSPCLPEKPLQIPVIERERANAQELQELVATDREALLPVSPSSPVSEDSVLCVSVDGHGDLLIKNNPDWMIERGERTLGPYRYLEIVKMLQKSIIAQNCKIKHASEDVWRLLADVREFDTSVIKKILSDKVQDASKLFIHRKFKRTSYLGPASIMYLGKLYRGTCTSISEGGCFVELRPSDFQLHKEIVVKIMPGTVPLSIEAKAKIVSINERSPRGIGMKFLELKHVQNEEIRRFVDKYTK
ncbi:MAG: PilZ domain-containing protein [Oligoflexia bacterium]|nr:PilZ domain-containing protein [Oligoflexia bacterium]